MTRLAASLASCLALAGAGAVAAGEPPAPATPSDLEGARALALAASLGLPGGNDGMFVNAGALAARRRYSIEAQFVQERVRSTRTWQWAQGSVVDSETSPVTGGFAYTRVSQGAATGNLYHVVVAGPLGGGFHLGATGKYLDLRSAAGYLGAATMDVGLYYQPVPLVGLGVAGYNLVPVGRPDQVPRALGTGFSLGDDQRLRLAVDWRRDLQRTGKATDAWAYGAEALLFDQFPLRAGFLRDGTRGGSYWSVGAGVVSASGLALDLAFRQSITFPDQKTVAMALKLFLPNPP